jgi:predicted glycoside hydrolase/deacetylase ChbG (UPF0249 family)
VNADDFGMSSDVNRAVVLAFQAGCVSSASVMSNMPGFVEACDWAQHSGFHTRVGVHLNLSEGTPLTHAIRDCPRFCDAAGGFRPRRSAFHLSVGERRAVEEEFRRQVQVCRDRNVQPTHLDSHHHYHTEWAIGALAIRVAKAFGVPAVRLSRNCGAGIGGLTRLYKVSYNARLRVYGLAKTRYFGSLDDVRQLLDTLPGDVEIMVHPRLNAGGVVTDGDGGAPLAPLIAALGLHGRLSSYADCE